VLSCERANHSPHRDSVPLTRCSAFLITDRIGRLWATRELCLVWIVGIVIYITSTSLGQLYAGRFIAGIGIGQTTVVAPTYLAEVAPKSIRGMCVCAFSGSVYLGILLGYFATYGTSLHIAGNNAQQWTIPTSMHIIFAGIITILSFFALESPRFLLKNNKDAQATQTLSTLRQLPAEHPYVAYELADIRAQLLREQEASHGNGLFSSLRELVATPSNRYRLMLGLMSQIMGQWSGAGSITIYAPDFFAALGVSAQSTKLFATGIFGIVKLVASLACALFLVDYLGRKRSLTIGICLQLFAMLYVAIYLTIVPAISEDETATHVSSAASHAGTGAIAMIYVSGVGWALGWNSIQYLINAEIFPLRVRALGSSIVMCAHFANQYGNSRAVPSMLLPGALGHAGTFWFFAAATLVGLGWVWFFLPETAGKSLEAMDELFALPWTVIGRKGAELTRGTGGLMEGEGLGEKETGAVSEVEDVEREGGRR
jgi:sugar porter (SP) family MFS transporter